MHNVLSHFFLCFFSLIFFILFSVGLALYLGELLGKGYYGFFALSGFYGLIAIIMAMNRREWLEIKLNDFLISQIFKEKDNVQN